MTLSLAGMDDDGFRFRHFFDGVLWAFFAEATVLQTTVRHAVGSPHRAPVDVDVAAVNMPGELYGGTDVTSEYASAQSIVRVVGEPNGVLDRLRTEHGYGGAEDFIANHFRVDYLVVEGVPDFDLVIHSSGNVVVVEATSPKTQDLQRKRQSGTLGLVHYAHPQI